MVAYEATWISQSKWDLVPMPLPNPWFGQDCPPSLAQPLGSRLATSAIWRLDVARWVKLGQKRLTTGRIHPFFSPNVPESFLENHTFDPFLTHFWSQRGPFSRQLGNNCLDNDRAARQIFIWTIVERIIFFSNLFLLKPSDDSRICAAFSLFRLLGRWGGPDRRSISQLTSGT